MSYRPAPAPPRPPGRSLLLHRVLLALLVLALGILGVLQHRLEGRVARLEHALLPVEGLDGFQGGGGGVPGSRGPDRGPAGARGSRRGAGEAADHRDRLERWLVDHQVDGVAAAGILSAWEAHVRRVERIQARPGEAGGDPARLLQEEKARFSDALVEALGPDRAEALAAEVFAPRSQGR